MEISWFKLIAVLLLNALGIALLIVSQNASGIVDQLAGKKAILLEGSESADTFKTPPVDQYQKIYMFDLQNYREVLQGAVPEVKQRGPYVFKIIPNKTMKWNGGKLDYTPSKTFKFDDSKSKGSLDDNFVTVDPNIVALVDQCIDNPECPESVFLEKAQPIGDILFRGTGDTGLNYLNPLQSGDDWFSLSENTYSVLTGQENLSDLNRIIAYDGSENITYYDEACNAFRGTNGERFAPFSEPPEFLTLFNPQLCKPWDVRYRGPSDVNGLKCVRYGAGRDFLSESFNTTYDTCINDPVEVADTGIDGVFPAVKCLPGPPSPPMLLSLPHFYNADPKLLKHVQGLSPSKDLHDFHFDVYPKLGFVIDMKIRVQINFHLKNLRNTTEVPEVIYPIFWQEIMLMPAGTELAASTVYSKVVSMRDLLFGLTLGFGALLVVVGQLLLLSSICSSRKSSDD